MCLATFELERQSLDNERIHKNCSWTGHSFFIGGCFGLKGASVRPGYEGELSIQADHAGPEFDRSN